jgi:hypothetical protein
MLNKITGFFHLLSGLTISSLPLIEKSDRSFDIFILAYSLNPISWMLCKNECIISYIVKKYSNPKYRLGDDPFKYMDITELFEYINLVKMLQMTYTTITVLQSASLVVVQQSTPSIHPLFFYIPMTLKIAYSTGYVTKHMFPYYQGITVTSFSLLLYKYFKK